MWFFSEHSFLSNKKKTSKQVWRLGDCIISKVSKQVWRPGDGIISKASKQVWGPGDYKQVSPCCWTLPWQWQFKLDIQSTVILLIRSDKLNYSEHDMVSNKK